MILRSGEGARSLATDAHGQFLAPYLTPGLYTVRVELPGFKSLEQRDVRVRLGQRAELDYMLSVGAFAEVVEVTAAAPVVDARSTTAGGVLDSDELLRLPVGRNFTDTLYLVPGVSDTSGVGNANPSIGGASGLDNNYVVDGVNITNTGFGGVGSYSIVFGSLGTGVTTDFIKETQVKTAGFEAEYGQATGGVVNVVTQSGTNAFHGSVYGYFRPVRARGRLQELQTPNGTVNTAGRQELDFGVTLGGPLMKDKLFFFGAFNPQYQTRTLIAPDGFPLQQPGRGRPQAARLLLRRQADLAGQARTTSSTSRPSATRRTATSARSALRALLAQDADAIQRAATYGGHNQALRYDGIIDPNWLVEASFAHATNNVTTRSPPSTSGR